LSAVTSSKLAKEVVLLLLIFIGDGVSSLVIVYASEWIHVCEIHLESRHALWRRLHLLLAEGIKLVLVSLHAHSSSHVVHIVHVYSAPKVIICGVSHTAHAVSTTKVVVIIHALTHRLAQISRTSDATKSVVVVHVTHVSTNYASKSAISTTKIIALGHLRLMLIIVLGATSASHYAGKWIAVIAT